MALDKLTIINNGGLSTTSDYRVGVLTATKFVGPIEGAITSADATFTGNVSIGGTLTYEDVTNIDSVGLITARDGIFIPDNKELKFGNTAASSDFRIYHNGSTNVLAGFTASDINIESYFGADVNIITNSNHYAIKCISNAQVELYHDNNVRLTTTDDGITVDKGVTINGIEGGDAQIRLRADQGDDNNDMFRFVVSDGGTGLKIQGYDGSFQTRVTVDTNGRLLLNNISSRSIANVTAKVQLEGTSADGSAISITRNSANVNPPYLNFGKSRATSTGGTTIIQDGDNLGEIRFSGADGNDLTNHAASINAEVDGTPGNNDTPGRLIFSTTSDGSSDATERLRIASNGKVGINIAGSDNTSPVRNLDIADSSGAILRLISTDDSLGANGRLGEIEFYSDDDDNAHIGAFIKAIAYPSDVAGRRTTILFGTQNHDASINAVEKVRLDCNGNVGIQTVNPHYELDLGGKALTQDDGTEYTLRIRSNNGKTAIRVGSGGGGSRVNLMRFDGDSNPGNGVGCSGDTNAGAYGGTLVYHGDRSGNENSFAVYMDQSASASQIEAFNIRQNGDYMHGGSSYSDRDQKENITAISGTALDKITQLSPKTWNWKPEYHDIPTDRIFAGFIAQEVQPHIPSIVTGTDGQGDMALDYQGLLAWTIKALTELKSENDDLKAKVAALEGS